MKDKLTTEYLETLGKVGLSSDSKLRLRNDLSSYADFHKVRIDEEVRSIKQVQSTSVFTLFTYSKLRIMKATLLIALMVGMGGSSLAAQNTVPGDLLYPIKVHVNENVRTAFTVGANAQAQLQLDLLAERIEEANSLAVTGKLQGDTAAAMQTHIAAQVDKTVSAAEQADAEVKADVKVAVSSALKHFSNRLAVVPTNSSARNDMNMKMDVSQSVAVRSGSEETADAMTMSAFGTGLAAEISSESVIEHAGARLEALRAVIEKTAVLNSQVKADVRAQLTIASEYLAEAQTNLKAGAEAQAEQSAQQAHEVMGEVESALSLLGSVEIHPSTGFIVDIDLSGNGSVGGGTLGTSGNSVNSGGTVHIDTQSNVQSLQDIRISNELMDAQAQVDAALDATIEYIGL